MSNPYNPDGMSDDEVERRTEPRPAACPVCGKGKTEGADRDGWPNTVSHLACVEKLEAELTSLKVESETTYGTWYTTVQQRAEQAEAELAALKARRCETCTDSSETEHGDFCCEIGIEMVDYEPFPDNFFCSEWHVKEKSNA